ncbi:PCNA-associated factor-like isoform X2 [Pomacea canaliculata]|uniref:PCNA-associated factor-like isoform X2 n=1 Tax=Pomacea canaliculata TaxID=400727 RepID=UPI000D72A4D1|nr:PCNA-associated factor-like isoform X2 [Pomacea canaliculata]
MVRTKADSCPASRKVVAARAPRKCLGASSSSSSVSSNGASPSGKKYAGGNPVCPRPTPDWQKGIDSFFTKKPADKENEEPDEEAEEEAGPSGLSSGCCASDVSNCPNSPCGPGFSSSVGGSSSNNNKDYTSTQDSTDDDS